MQHVKALGLGKAVIFFSKKAANLTKPVFEALDNFVLHEN